jgi:hypothetical protein
MKVVCAIPIQIPVHRVRVTVRCLATGGPLHTAAVRLADYWGESPEEIAEVLGLSIPRTQTLLSDLARGGEPIEREFVLWVDHARERVLPHSALSDAAVRPSKTGPYTLPVDPPTPNRLKDMGLAAGLSWDLGLEGHIEVLELIDVIADIRDSRALPHVLRLPDTQLVIGQPDTDSDTKPAATAPLGTPGTTPPAPTAAAPRFGFWIAQHGTIDPQLTGWARSNYQDDLDALIASADLASATTSPPATTIRKDVAELTGQGQWHAMEPHPGILREQLTQATEAASERLVLSAPDLRQIPTWLAETLQDAHERDVEIILRPGREDLIPTRATFPFETLPEPNEARSPGDPDQRFDGSRTEQHNPTHQHLLSVFADDEYALLHSDPAAVLDRRANPARQHLYTTRDGSAIGALLNRLGLPRLRPRAPRHKLTQEAIGAMLRNALAELRVELPKTVAAEIQPEDKQFALQTIERQRTPENPSRAARKTAAGIAWERILIALTHHLAAEHDHLQILAERWQSPANPRIDLDLIIADERKQIVWVIDAKNASPTNEHLHKLKAQLRLLCHTPGLTANRAVMGVIVHHRRHLNTSLQPTEDSHILRCTLQRLPDLLLAKRLPGQGLASV